MEDVADRILSVDDGRDVAEVTGEASDGGTPDDRSG